MRLRSAAFARKKPPETAVFATAFASQPPAQLCRLSAQNQRRGGHGLGADPIERAVSDHQVRTGRMSTFGQHSTPKRDLRQFRRLQIGSRASAAHSQHFPGQKLRLGGHGLGADPTYLLYVPSRSRGGLRRIDFGAWPRTAVSPRQIAPNRPASLCCTLAAFPRPDASTWS